MAALPDDEGSAADEELAIMTIGADTGAAEGTSLGLMANPAVQACGPGLVLRREPSPIRGGGTDACNSSGSVSVVVRMSSGLGEMHRRGDGTLGETRTSGDGERRCADAAWSPGPTTAAAAFGGGCADVGAEVVSDTILTHCDIPEDCR